MHDDLGFTLAQEFGNARDVDIREPPADVIGVRVRDKRMGDLDVVLGGDLEDCVDLPRRVDYGDLARLQRADQIHVVLHRPDLELFEIK